MRGINTLIRFSITWFAVFIIMAYFANDYLKIMVDGNVLLFNAFISLLAGLLIVGGKHNKVHFGHMPLIIGFVMLAIGWGYLYGNIEFEAFEKTKWWNITDTTIKTQLGIIGLIGVGLFTWGIKLMWNNLFFLRPFGARKM